MTVKVLMNVKCQIEVPDNFTRDQIDNQVDNIDTTIVSIL